MSALTLASGTPGYTEQPGYGWDWVNVEPFHEHWTGCVDDDTTAPAEGLVFVGENSDGHVAVAGVRDDGRVHIELTSIVPPGEVANELRRLTGQHGGRAAMAWDVNNSNARDWFADALQQRRIAHRSPAIFSRTLAMAAWLAVNRPAHQRYLDVEAGVSAADPAGATDELKARLPASAVRSRSYPLRGRLVRGLRDSLLGQVGELLAKQELKLDNGLGDSTDLSEDVLAPGVEVVIRAKGDDLVGQLAQHLGRDGGVQAQFRVQCDDLGVRVIFHESPSRSGGDDDAATSPSSAGLSVEARDGQEPGSRSPDQAVGAVSRSATPDPDRGTADFPRRGAGSMARAVRHAGEWLEENAGRLPGGATIDLDPDGPDGGGWTMRVTWNPDCADDTPETGFHAIVARLTEGFGRGLYDRIDTAGLRLACTCVCTCGSPRQPGDAEFRFTEVEWSPEPWVQLVVFSQESDS